MNVNLLLFASCADIVGSREMTVEVADGGSLDDLMGILVSNHPKLGKLRKSMMVSVNQEYVGVDFALSDGDEVALIPPVSGGGPPPRPS